MKKLSISFIVLTTFFVAIAVDGQKVPSGNPKDLKIKNTYIEDDSIIPNPERGWFIYQELRTGSGNINKWPTETQLRGYFSRGYRLSKHITMIPTNKDPIPQYYLDSLQKEADLMRANGFKVIYRFNYNNDHKITKDDAPRDIVLMHLDQLKPFFEKNKDILFVMEIGFIGYWGEMHSSANGHNMPGTSVNSFNPQLSQSGKDIIHKILEVMPADRFVGVRYPPTIYRDSSSYGSLGFTTPLNEQTAYSGSEQSRMASWYANFGGGQMLYHKNTEYSAKWGPETRFVPQWAHCDYFSTVTDDPAEWLIDGEQFHYVALSNPKDEKRLQKMYNLWTGSGAYDIFAKKLGYRYRLIESTLDDNVSRGGELNIQLKVANDGWARATNPRAVEIVLRNRATSKENVIKVSPPKDFRLWFPEPGEKEKILDIVVEVPSGLAAGKYDIFINLPDPEPSIHNRPEYSMRLANKDIWDASKGYNKLATITVTKSSARRTKT